MRQYPSPVSGLRSLVALGWFLNKSGLQIVEGLLTFFSPFPTGVLLQQLKQRRSYGGEVLVEASIVSYGSDERPKFC